MDIGSKQILRMIETVKEGNNLTRVRIQELINFLEEKEVLGSTTTKTSKMNQKLTKSALFPTDEDDYETYMQSTVFLKFEETDADLDRELAFIQTMRMQFEKFLRDLEVVNAKNKQHKLTEVLACMTRFSDDLAEFSKYASNRHKQTELDQRQFQKERSELEERVQTLEVDLRNQTDASKELKRELQALRYTYSGQGKGASTGGGFGGARRPAGPQNSNIGLAEQGVTQNGLGGGGNGLNNLSPNFGQSGADEAGGESLRTEAVQEYERRIQKLKEDNFGMMNDLNLRYMELNEMKSKMDSLSKNLEKIMHENKAMTQNSSENNKLTLIRATYRESKALLRRLDKMVKSPSSDKNGSKKTSPMVNRTVKFVDIGLDDLKSQLVEERNYIENLRRENERLKLEKTELQNRLGMDEGQESVILDSQIGVDDSEYNKLNFGGSIKDRRRGEGNRGNNTQNSGDGATSGFSYKFMKSNNQPNIVESIIEAEGEGDVMDSSVERFKDTPSESEDGEREPTPPQKPQGGANPYTLKSNPYANEGPSFAGSLTGGPRPLISSKNKDSNNNNPYTTGYNPNPYTSNTNNQNPYTAGNPYTSTQNNQVNLNPYTTAGGGGSGNPYTTNNPYTSGANNTNPYTNTGGGGNPYVQNYPAGSQIKEVRIETNQHNVYQINVITVSDNGQEHSQIIKTNQISVNESNYLPPGFEVPKPVQTLRVESITPAGASHYQNQIQSGQFESEVSPAKLDPSSFVSGLPRLKTNELMQKVQVESENISERSSAKLNRPEPVMEESSVVGNKITARDGTIRPSTVRRRTCTLVHHLSDIPESKSETEESMNSGIKNITIIEPDWEKSQISLKNSSSLKNQTNAGGDTQNQAREGQGGAVIDKKVDEMSNGYNTSFAANPNLEGSHGVNKRLSDKSRLNEMYSSHLKQKINSLTFDLKSKEQDVSRLEDEVEKAKSREKRWYEKCASLQKVITGVNIVPELTGDSEIDIIRSSLKTLSKSKAKLFEEKEALRKELEEVKDRYEFLVKRCESQKEEIKSMGAREEVLASEIDFVKKIARKLKICFADKFSIQETLIRKLKDQVTQRMRAGGDDLQKSDESEVKVLEDDIDDVDTQIQDIIKMEGSKKRFEEFKMEEKKRKLQKKIGELDDLTIAIDLISHQ